MIPPCGVPVCASYSLPSSMHACVHPLHQQTHHARVPDPVLEKLLHPSMIDGVEERSDVCVEHPVDLPFDRLGQRIQCIVRRPLRSEAVRNPQKLGLAARLQHHPHRLLDDLVLQRRDAEQSSASIAFRDVHPPYRLRVMAATVYAVLQVDQALVETLAVFVPSYPVPPLTRRALPTCSPTSSVPCPRPTPRRPSRISALHLPVTALRPPQT